MKLTNEVVRQMKWQWSPLKRAIDDVIAASTKHLGYQVGRNRATSRVVGAAAALRELREEIELGYRDGLGYPIEEEIAKAEKHQEWAVEMFNKMKKEGKL